MIIGGLQQFSLLDYPEKISAIVFTQGCNFRCQFCYNPTLVLPNAKGKTNQNKKGQPLFTEVALFDFLATRQGKLDAVVITGGEPTLHSDLAEFIMKIRDLGYLVKLDTNGTRPEALKNLYKNKLIDYVAMDIKGPKEKYDTICGVKVQINDIIKSIEIIMKSNTPYEFRTTVVPDFIKTEDISQMGKMIKGADKWFLQAFKPEVDLINPELQNTKTYPESEMKKLQNIASKYVKTCKIR